MTTQETVEMDINYTQKPNLEELSESEFFALDTPPFDVKKHCLYSVISGSKAYGLDTPTSDTDIRGVVYLPERMLFGLGKCEQIENQSKDICYWSVKRAFELLLKNNPHIMEVIWNTRTVHFIHPLFQSVLDNKHIFTSKRLGYAYSVYAHQQLILLDTKRKNGTGRVAQMENWAYDYKFAMHTVRLLRSGAEFLNSGELQVYRPDKKELLEIRNGKYSFEEFVKFEENNKKKQIVGGMIKDEIRKFEEAFENSTLPNEPPFEQIEKLLITLQKNCLTL